MSDYILAIPGTTPTPVTWQALCDAYPSTVFPLDLSGLESDFHIYPLGDGVQPRYDPATEKLVQGPVTQSGGLWSRTWSVVPLTPAELMARAPVVPAPDDTEDRLAALDHRIAALETKVTALETPKLNP